MGWLGSKPVYDLLDVDDWENVDHEQGDQIANGGCEVVKGLKAQ